MIEMLGVLAIIGVLSAGGIWGYTLAMENYKFNSFVDNTLKTATNLRNLLKNKPNKVANFDVPTMCKVGILPEIWCQNSVGVYLKNDIAKDSSVYFILFDYPEERGLFFAGIFNFHYCVKLLTYPWNEVFLYSIVDTRDRKNARYLPLSISDAENYCHTFGDSQILFTFIIVK